MNELIQLGLLVSFTKTIEKSHGLQLILPEHITSFIAAFDNLDDCIDSIFLETNAFRKEYYRTKKEYNKHT